MNANTKQHINFDANSHKIRLGLRLGNYIESLGIYKYPAVYLASGLDLELPLVLRARRIIMIDPIFTLEQNIEAIRQKIIMYDPSGLIEKKVSTYHYNFTFSFDFGYGPETVYLDIFAKTYQDFDYLSPIGYILEFNNELDHCLFKSDLMEKLITNGLIIDNQESPLRTQKPSIFDMVFYGQNPDILEDKRAAAIGLKTIRIENIPFTIYQKLYKSNRLLNYQPS